MDTEDLICKYELLICHLKKIQEIEKLQEQSENKLENTPEHDKNSCRELKIKIIFYSSLKNHLKKVFIVLKNK